MYGFLHSLTFDIVYICAYTLNMEFKWDPQKASINLDKHGVDFADAATVLFDEMALTLMDESADEQRFITMGADAMGRLLIVVYALRGEDKVRLISARKATRHERLKYEEKQ
jgi:hypothetical protein